MKRRLFVAVTLDEASREACRAVAERLRARGWDGDARWVPPENYHLTVAFLGAVPEERVGEIAAALAEIAPKLERFTLPLDTVGAFPETRHPRLAWVGPGRPIAAFGTLCGVVRSTLVALGYTFDPHADPHVTIARGDGRTALPPVAPPPARAQIDAVTLYESLAAPSGVHYQPLARVPFGR